MVLKQLMLSIFHSLIKESKGNFYCAWFPHTHTACSPTPDKEPLFSPPSCPRFICIFLPSGPQNSKIYLTDFLPISPHIFTRQMKERQIKAFPWFNRLLCPPRQLHISSKWEGCNLTHISWPHVPFLPESSSPSLWALHTKAKLLLRKRTFVHPSYQLPLGCRRSQPKALVSTQS